jgi:hypothetical protein
MKKVDQYLDSINQPKLLSKKVEAKMAQLAGKAELMERVDEELALNKNLFEDFRCSFCLCFPLDPVMCPKCVHVFCLECQKAYYKKPANVDCSYCRQNISKEDRLKPMNKKLRKKMTKLLLKCTDCSSILISNDHGVGQGEHASSCQEKVRVKCGCGLNFSSRFAETMQELRQHLIKKCPTVLSPNARKLSRISNRFEELGVPQALIEFYRKQEPYHFLLPLEDSSSIQTKTYVYADEKTGFYEGEVDAYG